MTKESDRFVVTRGDDGWAVMPPNAERASSVHRTQEKAMDAARELIKRHGGGEMVVQKKKGPIGKKNTIAPGNDPFPPRG